MTYYARKDKQALLTGFWQKAAMGVFFCLLLLGGRAFAQVNSATINGVVSDSSGAAVPGAIVTATNLGTGIESSHTTDETGHYTIVNLVPGSYDVKASAQGLASVIRQKQELLVGVTDTFNFSLAVASVTQTVQVDTAPPEVDTTQSILNTVIETKDMDDLPTLSRGYTSLAALSPGVYVGAGSSTASASITIGTANSWSVGYVLDGASNAKVMGNGNTANVAQDWIQEFSVVTDQAPAEYAFASSGYVNAVTRSGGNALHGRVYGYFQDASLNADPGFLAAGATKPPYDQQRLGGTLGGPINQFDGIQVFNSDPVSVNMALSYNRYDREGKKLLRCDGVYCATNNDGRWALQMASTIFTPAELVGTSFPDAEMAAKRLRVDHDLQFVTRDASFNATTTALGPTIGLGGGGTPTAAAPARTAAGLKHSQTYIRMHRPGGVMSLFKVKGVKSRLTVREVTEEDLKADAEPIDYEEYRDTFKALGVGPWGWVFGVVPSEKIIHTTADKVHLITGATRYTATGEVINTDARVAIAVYRKGRWGLAGGLSYVMTLDRGNDGPIPGEQA